MTTLQRLQLRQSEIREKINTLLGLETRTEEQDGELVKLTGEGTALEVELRAAIIAQPDPAEVRVEGDAETRELPSPARAGQLSGASLSASSSIGTPMAGKKRSRTITSWAGIRFPFPCFALSSEL